MIRWISSGVRLRPPVIGNRRARSRARLWLSPLEERTVPALYTVNSTADLGTGTGTTGDLRYCLTQANAAPGADSITFDPTVFATAKTIVLTGSELPVSDDVTITGPGAAQLTVSGNKASRVFNVNGP